MIAHRFAITPMMDFQTKGLGLGEASLVDAHIHGSLPQSQPNVPRVGGNTNWFGFWEVRDDVSDFVVGEPSHPINTGNGYDADALPNLA